LIKRLVIPTIFVALHLRHRLVDEHLIWIGVAKLTMALNINDTAMKVVNHSDIDDDVGRPGNVQTLDLEVAAFLSTASRNTLAAEMMTRFNLTFLTNSEPKSPKKLTNGT
jgi:hypothetical protein